MIIPVAGIDGNRSATTLLEAGQGVNFRRVIQPEHDNGADLAPERCRRSPPPGGLLQPVHGSVVAVGDGLVQALSGSVDRIRTGYAERAKPLKLGQVVQ